MRLLRELGLMQIDDTGVWVEESVEDAVRRIGLQPETPMPPDVPAPWLHDSDSKSPPAPPAPLANPNLPSPPAPTGNSGANATSISVPGPASQGPPPPPGQTPAGQAPVPPPAPAATPTAYLGAEHGLKPIIIPDDYATEKPH
jgi:hypothetical protein